MNAKTGQGHLAAAAAALYISGAGWLASGLLNLGALAAERFSKGTRVPGALYPMLAVDGWMFSLLCVLSFSLMGALALAGARGVQKRLYWARSVGLSHSLMAAVSAVLLAAYAYLAPGLLLSAGYLGLLIFFLLSRQMEDAFPVWVSRHGRAASQFSLLFLINATAFGSLVLGPLLPLLRFRHMSGGTYGVPLCSIGSISRCLSGNWADLLLAPVFLIAVLMLVGLLVGRALCGWGCPIGFLQDLAARAKAAVGAGDIEPSRRTHDRLKLLKYALLLFVLLLAGAIGISHVLSPAAQEEFVSGLAGFPLFQSGATPCEACPAPITGYFLPDDVVRNGLAGTFVLTPEAGLRLFVLAGFIVGAFLVPRFFCRYFCPAGAMAAIFNRTSALSIEKEQEKCTECNYCVTACPMRIRKLKEEHVDSRVHDMECTFCLECIDSCPERALSLGFQGKPIYKGGKEWWLKILKETEGAGEMERGAGGGAGGRGLGGGAGGVVAGKGGAAGLSLLLALAFILPSLLSPGASGARFDGTNLPPRDGSGSHALGSGDVWTLSGTSLTVNGSVKLDENATLVLEKGATLTINGDLWLAGQSTVSVDASTLVVNVPEQPPMRIEQLYSGPNGFVLIDERAGMTLTDSTLKVSRLQQALMGGIARPSWGAPGTEFTYFLTYTDPANRPFVHMNVVLDGTAFNLSRVDPDDTTYRDGIFLFHDVSLGQGNHTYHFEGQGPDGPLRYPASGEIPGPDVGTDEPLFLFGSEMLVNFGRFEASSSTLDLDGTFYTHMSSWMELRRTTLVGGLTIEINPTCLFHESNIQSMVVKERTGRMNVMLYDCTVGTAVIESVSGVLFERCTVETLDCQSDSITTVVSSTVRYFNSGGNASATLDRSRVIASEFPFMRLRGDSRLTAFNDSALGRVHLDDRALLYLTYAVAEKVEACGDARIWSEYATIQLYELADNATIYNTLKVRARLNGLPAAVNIEVHSQNGTLLVSALTREDGFRSFAVPIRIVRPGSVEEIDRCCITASYQALRSVEEFSLKGGGSELNVSLEDRTPPTVTDVSFEYYYRPAGEALVRARVDDGSGSGLMSVRVRYSLDGGEWRERPLHPVGGGRYEGNLTGLKSRSELTFTVVATDWMNNSRSSPERTERLGLPPLAAALAGAGLLATVGAAAAVYWLIRHGKIRRYLDGARAKNEK